MRSSFEQNKIMLIAYGKRYTAQYSTYMYNLYTPW